jgi:hypothetical protein
VERVPDDGGLGCASVHVDAESGGLGGAVIGHGDALPGADGQFGRGLDGSRAVGPEMDHAPAQLAVDDEEFDARGVAVPGIEAGGVQHRGPGVLLTQAQEGGKSEGVEAAELLEFGKLEAGIAIELHALAFDRRRELEVFR